MACCSDSPGHRRLHPLPRAAYPNPGPILTILEDRAGAPGQRGDLWVGRAAGPMSKLAPGSEQLVAYGQPDGLPKTIFRQGGIVPPTERSLSAASTGMIMFDPARLKLNQQPPQVVLTRFLLANQSVGVSSGSPLAQSINENEQITLPYNDSVISFQVAGLDYRAPEKNRYRYILQGFDPVGPRLTVRAG